MSPLNESGLSGVKLRSMNFNALEFVAVEDVIKAFEDYPYQKVMACLHKIAQPVYTPPDLGECSRFSIWSSPSSHNVLKELCQLPDTAKMPDALVLDMLLSACLQQYWTGSVDFLSSVEMYRHSTELSKAVSVDLDVLAEALYPGVYTQTRRDSRLRWIQNVKKHAGSLVSQGFLLSASPKEGEAGRILKVEFSSSSYAELSSSIKDSPVYISYVPCTAFRIGRGAYKQSPALYTAYRLLCTCLGLKYGHISAGISHELLFEEFYSATGLPVYEEWCSQHPESNPDPARYCESVIGDFFKQLGSLLSVQVLYQDQKVVIVSNVDIYADKVH